MPDWDRVFQMERSLCSIPRWSSTDEFRSCEWGWNFLIHKSKSKVVIEPPRERSLDSIPKRSPTREDHFRVKEKKKCVFYFRAKAPAVARLQSEWSYVQHSSWSCIGMFRLERKMFIIAERLVCETHLSRNGWQAMVKQIVLCSHTSRTDRKTKRNDNFVSRWKWECHLTVDCDWWFRSQPTWTANDCEHCVSYPIPYLLY